MVRLWWNILVANLATNFQDLVAKVKNLVALAPVLGTISRPAKDKYTSKFLCPVEPTVFVTFIYFEQEGQKVYKQLSLYRIIFVSEANCAKNPKQKVANLGDTKGLFLMQEVLYVPSFKNILF